MFWLSLLKGLLSLAGAVADMLHDKQLLDAGEAKAIKDNLYDTLQKIRKAEAARAGVKHDVDSVRNDPHNRDNH